MLYKKLIEEYVTSENIVDMFMLTKLTDDFISEVDKIDHELVKNFVMNLKMYMHPLRDKECAEYAVSKLVNEDGSKGQHWDFETTSKLADKYEIYNKPAFYYVLNMIYSDFYESGRADSEYVKDAVKFMNDKDAPHDKAERYYRAMNY
jgi:hypothetical protein